MSTHSCMSRMSSVQACTSQLVLRNIVPVRRVRRVAGDKRSALLSRLMSLRTRPPFSTVVRSVPATTEEATTQLWDASVITTQPAKEPAYEGSHIDWFKQWYPVGVLQDLDPSRPQSVVLLGKRLVVWRDAKDHWRCFDDRCPHRLASLSEGRLDSAGNLFCNYHGWSFSGNGNCVSIPQLPHEGWDKALGSTRACATAHPTACADGLLFVWLDSSPQSFAEAEAAGPPGVFAGDEATSGFHMNERGWYVRKMPVSYVSAKENAFNDPAHDPVLHHGIVGIKRSFAQPLHIKDLQGPTPAGYKGTWTFDKVTWTVDVTAQLPVGQRFDRKREGQIFISQAAYVVPTTGPWACTLYFADFVPSGAKHPITYSWLWRLVGGKPVWLQHIDMHQVVDADVAIQHSVDQQRAAGAHSVYMPAATDALFRLFHKWLRTYGGGGPPFTIVEPQPPSLPREQLLDRFHSHTAGCRQCSEAYYSVQRMQVVAKAVSALSFFLACAAALSRGLDWLSVALLAAAALGSAAAAALRRLEQQFVFVDYDKHHPSKN